MKGVSASVQGFYNNRPFLNRKERDETPSISVRRFNNFVKSALIQDAFGLVSGDNLLVLGGGISPITPFWQGR